MNSTAWPPLQEEIEWERCRRSPEYFIRRHCRIYDATERVWLPFDLWPAQAESLAVVHAQQLTVILKARQLGCTWLVLAYALWVMLFRPAATVLLFSRREDEALYLLSDERLRGMFRRLPAYLRCQEVGDAAKTWSLENGSVARSFPTTAGDSYTATMAIVDEADLCPDLGKLLRSVKPTIDGGGKLILLSRSDKTQPQSEFKRTYQAARAGTSPWRAIFLPWHVRPGRDQAWYDAQKADVVARTGSLDDLHEQYPATDTEALAPRSLDKRIAPAWLHQCYQPRPPLASLPHCAPSIPGLDVYVLPTVGRRYIVTADPAEGNPTSDDSASTVFDRATGEEVASLSGKIQPSTLGDHVGQLATWYNRADAMIERNNHGHAVLLQLRQFWALIRRLLGHDGKEGWLSSGKGKTLLYDACADAFRNGETILHSFATFVQLSSIEGNTLRAPEGEMDDRADAYALGPAAIVHSPASQGLPAAGGHRSAPMPGQTPRPMW